MTGPWDTGPLVRDLVNRLQDDDWLPKGELYRVTGPGDVVAALNRVFESASVGRKSVGVLSPRVAAENFLRDTVNKDVPLAERMHAAALLLQVKP